MGQSVSFTCEGVMSALRVGREEGEGKEVWDGKGCLLEDEEGVES